LKEVLGRLFGWAILLERIYIYLDPGNLRRFTLENFFEGLKFPNFFD